MVLVVLALETVGLRSTGPNRSSRTGAYLGGRYRGWQKGAEEAQNTYKGDGTQSRIFVRRAPTGHFASRTIRTSQTLRRRKANLMIQIRSLETAQRSWRI